MEFQLEILTKSHLDKEFIPIIFFIEITIPEIKAELIPVNYFSIEKLFASTD